MKLDIVAFAAHPDDVELFCAGLLINEIRRGKEVGVVDLTRGELGSNGNMHIRLREAKEAAKVMGLHARENLRMKDGFFTNDIKHQMLVIEAIRKYQPTVVLCNAPYDRHPDHGRASHLVKDAFFLSGLVKVKSYLKGKAQEAWRPSHLLYYIQDQHITPDFYVDISSAWEKKITSIHSYSSQFHTPSSDKRPIKDTYISSDYFMQSLEARHRYYGKMIGTTYAEGFLSAKPIGVNDLSFLLKEVLF